MSATCRIDVKKYRAVLFDLDGVIADTMSLHYEAFRQAFARYGLQVTPLEIYELEGMPSKEVGKALVKRKGARMTDEQVLKAIEDKREIYRSLAAKDAKTFAGVTETLQMLRKNGIKLALVTGSNLKTVTEVLNKIGLEGAFDSVISGMRRPGKTVPRSLHERHGASRYPAGELCRRGKCAAGPGIG